MLNGAAYVVHGPPSTLYRVHATPDPKSEDSKVTLIGVRKVLPFTVPRNAVAVTGGVPSILIPVVCVASMLSALSVEKQERLWFPSVGTRRGPRYVCRAARSRLEF